MYNVSATIGYEGYEHIVCDIDEALRYFFHYVQRNLSTSIIDCYTGEVYVTVNDETIGNYVTDEWRYILIGYLAHHEMGFDISGFEEVEDND